jgi:hypothetical protein
VRPQELAEGGGSGRGARRRFELGDPRSVVSAGEADVAAARLRPPIGGEDQAGRVGLQDRLNAMPRDQPLQQGCGAPQLSEAEHDYFWQNAQ